MTPHKRALLGYRVKCTDGIYRFVHAQDAKDARPVYGDPDYDPRPVFRRQIERIRRLGGERGGLPKEKSATQETTMTEPAKWERAESEAVEQKSKKLTVQVLWGCHAFNATPEEAAQQVVADLLDHLSRGGSVSVHVSELGGSEHTLEVTARR